MNARILVLSVNTAQTLVSIQRLVFANERFCLRVALPAWRESDSAVYIGLAGRQQGIPVPGALADTTIVSMKRRYRNTPTAPPSQPAALSLGALNKNTDTRSDFQTM